MVLDMVLEFCGNTLAETVVGVSVEVKTSRPANSKRPLIATINFFTFLYPPNRMIG